jgi:hypothetical protein
VEVFSLHQATGSHVRSGHILTTRFSTAKPATKAFA